MLCKPSKQLALLLEQPFQSRNGMQSYVITGKQRGKRSGRGRSSDRALVSNIHNRSVEGRSREFLVTQASMSWRECVYIKTLSPCGNDCNDSTLHSAHRCAVWRKNAMHSRVLCFSTQAAYFISMFAKLTA